MENEMTRKQGENGYKFYEHFVDKEVKSGRLSREQASRNLKKSKENYRNQKYNHDLERINR